MPATPQVRRTDADMYKNGPDKKIQLPQLPKQLEGKFVRGQMYAYQDSLPKLPVPPLEQTLKKYIKCIQHLVSSGEFEKTKKVVAEFGRPGGIGEELQKKLLKRAEEKESWLEDLWMEHTYLRSMKPTGVYSNPGAGFLLQPSEDRESYARLIARLVLGNVKWNMLIESHALPPDVIRRTPLCMVQLDLHSKCRVPTDKTTPDLLRKTALQQSRHMIMARNGHFYKLDLLYECPDGSLAMAPPTHIVKELLSILETAPDTCEHPVGVLTSEHRDNWYSTREKLMLDPINKASLEAIETSQGVACLDKAHSTDSTRAHHNLKYWDQLMTRSVNTCIHGSGSNQHSCNRWFDSAVQLLIGEDGNGGGTLEHSAADGVSGITVIPFLFQIQGMYDVLTETSPVPESSLRPFQPLEWNISPAVARDIEVAKEKLDESVKNFDMNTFTFDEFGKDFLKSMKLSPDGFLQNAILLTSYRVHGCIPSMVESASTRMFKLGRTDFIRNTTSEAVAFIQTMQDSSASNGTKVKTLLAAIKAHSQAITEAMQGQAFDRHLLGLALMARDSGMEVPDMFVDDSYVKTSQFLLLASQVPVPSGMCLCFAARGRDGYGICYNPLENEITITVACFHSCPDTDSILFLETLSKILNELRDILVDAYSM